MNQYLERNILTNKQLKGNKMKTLKSFFSVLQIVMLLFVITSFINNSNIIAQDLDDILEELKVPLELTEEQEPQVAELLGKYATELNEMMAKNDESEEVDPKVLIGDFKSVQDSYQKGLKKVLSKDQYKKYEELVKGILLEMFTDIAEIKLIDLQEPLNMTEDQLEKLAPVMGESLMGVVKVVIEYGDKKMNMRNKIKIGKRLKKIKSKTDTETAKILTPEQIETWDKIKEENKKK